MRICVSIGETTAAEALERLGLAENSDLIEIRFDHLPEGERRLLVNELSTSDLRSKLIATLRPFAEGGRADISREDRTAFFNSLRGYFACDLEEDIAQIAPDAKVKIVSFHDHSGVPRDISDICERLASFRPDVVKLACAVDDVADALPLWKLLGHANDKGIGVVPIAMGEAGKWTRILGAAFGAPLAYAAPDRDSATAPGQISLAELTDHYRINEITANTAVLGVIGDPVSSSLSPAVHNAAFAANGDDAVFLPFQVKHIEKFFRRMVRSATREAEINFRGFAVTMPHKLVVMPLLDEVDGAASDIGAVNTVEFSGGKLIGRNTDAAGFIVPLTARFGDLGGMRLAIIGSGGASRACIYSLLNCNADVTVYARDVTKAAAELERFDVKIKPFSVNAKFDEFDLVVNATPVGMKGERLLSADQISGVRCLYDLITKKTPIIEEARSAGIDVIEGREMLLEQGILQYEIWMKGPAPRAAMLRAMNEVS